jgi:hypothetical protein
MGLNDTHQIPHILGRSWKDDIRNIKRSRVIQQFHAFWEVGSSINEEMTFQATLATCVAN